MTSATISTIVKRIEAVPEGSQDRVIEHMREYIADLEDERNWDEAFDRTRDKLAAEARRVKQDIAEGRSEPMELGRL